MKTNNTEIKTVIQNNENVKLTFDIELKKELYDFIIEISNNDMYKYLGVIFEKTFLKHLLDKYNKNKKILSLIKDLDEEEFNYIINKVKK
jgi:hypothetical protein